MKDSYIECYPDAAQYREDQDVSIVIDATPEKQTHSLQIRVSSIDGYLQEKYVETEGKQVIALEKFPRGMYGVDLFEDGTAVAHTAFDVTEETERVVRYGFLTDFGTEETTDEDIEFANKMHLTAIQFYDWMYRHDDLVYDGEEYDNPLGISISNHVLRHKIDLCKKHHIRPFAYGAVYAASKSFYEKHREWAMYTQEKEPITFADWLVFMNINRECGWSGHILEQFARAVKTLGVQGIHMDTYGYPKKAWTLDGEPINLEKDFPELINASAGVVQREDPEAGVIFNAVNDWPVESVAGSAQDSIYIEVWPPHDTYLDLMQLISKARSLSGGKQVILAAYMHPFAEKNNPEGAEKSFLLTFAVIHASGGYQLVLGENKGILCDSYYNKYATLRDEFLPKVKAYSDFVVHYGELLFAKAITDISMTATGGINEDILFSSEQTGFSVKPEADKVWTKAGITDHRIILHLINLKGENSLWNVEKTNAIIAIEDIGIRVLLDRRIRNVFWASPDTDGGMPKSLDYSVEMGAQGKYLCLKNQRVEVWSTIWIDFE